MAKFHGVIGYTETAETAPGVHSEVVIEKVCRGDVLYDARHWEKGEGLNDNLKVSNRISVIGTAFAFTNIPNMRYVKWMNTCWKISTVEVKRPRLILTLGDVYNGP
jgi:hypothetical protein